MQGVILTYDPTSGEGVVVRDTDREQFLLARGALDSSILTMLRQGQRVIFDLDGHGHATGVKLGSEVDMGLPPDIQV